MRNINWPTLLFLFLTPLVALSWGGVHLAEAGIGWVEIASFAAFYTATAVSITAGYHRLFAHRAYECRRVVKVFYLLFGAAAFQNSVLTWASDHRRHHKNIDQDGDPYNIRRGFLWAHIGWLLFNDHKQNRFENVRDLEADPLIRLQHRFYFPIASAVSFGLPFAIGLAFGRPWTFLLWGGVIRLVAAHHSTFLVNSLAHTLGRRPYTRAVSARDSVVTAVLTFGEGYHNFHHRFAADYRNGVRRYQWDPTKWLIRALASVGWAWNLRRVPRDRIVAAEIQCETQRLFERIRDCSENVRVRVRARVDHASAVLHRTATRLAALESDLSNAMQSRANSGSDMRSLREEIRRARREFRFARSSWRMTLESLAQPACLQMA